MNGSIQQILSNEFGVRHYYGGREFPPGGVEVEDRDLARFITPGAMPVPHGVVPIGVLGLPSGSVMTELEEADFDSIRCLPFRFPWYRQAYALKCSEFIFAVVRNVQPNEVRAGSFAVVQLNDAHHWETTFGKIKRVNLSSILVQTCAGEEKKISHEHIHFVGKIAYWWDDRATEQVWVELESREVVDGLEGNRSGSADGQREDAGGDSGESGGGDQSRR